MIECKRVAELLTSGNLERETGWERWRVRMHLWLCKKCSKLARQLQQIREAGRRLRSSFEAEKPAGGEGSLEARLARKLQTADGGTYTDDRRGAG